MREVVINRCFGGFGLSDKAVMRYAELAGIQLTMKPNKYSPSSNVFTLNDEYWSYRDIKRDDVFLVTVVEELGREANGDCAELRIVEIPDDVEWHIEEYDGFEHVAENHRTWS